MEYTTMNQYPNLLRQVYEQGESKGDIQGIGNVAIFGATLRFKPAEAFPLTPIRKLPFYKLLGELLWMLRGDTTLEGLHKYGVLWWDSYDTPEVRKIYHLEEGHLGPSYGKQIRSFSAGGKKDIDQLLQVQESLKKDPNSRRHVISLWNPKEVDEVYYAPCLTQFKFYVNQEKLSLAVVQRSADIAGGVPFDIAEMAIFLLMMAQVTNLISHELVYFLEDTHIYNDQRPQVEELLKREIRPLPTVILNPKTRKFTDIREFLELMPEEIVTLENYNPHDPLRIPVSAR